MKTSNILFTILIGLGFLLITAFTLEMKTWSKHETRTLGGVEQDEPTTTVELPQFSHIKIRDMHNLRLVTSASAPRIEKMAIADSVEAPSYFLSGDTLMISPTNTPTDYVSYRIVCSQGLKSITTENTHLTLSSFATDTLSLLIGNSVIRASDLESSYGTVNIMANSDSRIEWFAGQITDLTLEMDSSNGVFQLPIHSVKADLTSSYLQLKEVDKLMMEKRGESKIEIWE